MSRDDLSQDEQAYLDEAMARYLAEPTRALPPPPDDLPPPSSSPAALVVLPQRPVYYQPKLPPGIPPAPPMRRGPQGVEYLRTCPGPGDGSPCGTKHWVSRQAPSDRCPPCNGIYLLREGRRRREEAVVHALGRIPEKYRVCTFASPEAHARVRRPEVLLPMVQGWASFEEKPLITLMGDTGVGKSTLAACVLRAHIDRALAPGAGDADKDWTGRTRWYHAKKLSLVRRESTLGKKPADLEDALAASVLVLDDLGQEAPELKDDVVDVLTTREEQSLLTVVTTGLSLAKLEVTYGAQLARRLTAKERVWWLALGKAKGASGG